MFFVRSNGTRPAPIFEMARNLACGVERFHRCQLGFERFASRCLPSDILIVNSGCGGSDLAKAEHRAGACYGMSHPFDLGCPEIPPGDTRTKLPSLARRPRAEAPAQSREFILAHSLASAKR